MNSDQKETSLEATSRRGRPRIDREDRTDSREETGRGTRVPLGVARPKLTVPERKGYVRRWVNDVEGRLQMAEQGGYQFVENQSFQVGGPDVSNENRDLGSRKSYVVDKSTGMKAYLMEIKEEYFREDQRIKMREVDEIDAAIKRGTLHDDDARYVPEKGKGIKISRT